LTWNFSTTREKRKEEKMAASAFVGGSQKNVKDVSSTSASCKEA